MLTKQTATALLLATALASSSLDAAKFVEAEKDVILFKVDQLPIDKDTMQWCANALLEIVARQQQGTAEELRANAQLLAVARQLHPNNERITQLSNSLKFSSLKSFTKAENVNKAQSRVWAIVRYLDSEEAGTEANILARRIKDAMLVIDPKHPELANYRENNKRWDKVIPHLSAYRSPENKAPKANNPPEKDKDSQALAKHESKPAIDKQPEAERPNERDRPKGSEKQEASAWKTTKFAITVPSTLFFRDLEGKDQHKRQLSKFDISLTQNNNKEKRNSLEINSAPVVHSHGDKLQGQHHLVQAALRSQWQSFPGAKVSVALKDAYSYRNDKEAAAALAVGLDAALRGEQVRRNLMVCANINGKGEFYRSNNLWKQSKMLADKAKNYRILVAPESEGDFRQLIALEKPEFFVHNEVIAVASLEEASQLSGAEDDSQAAQASALFKEFQNVAGNRSVGPLITNRHVRAKLEEILALMPNHLSAKMLLLQGSGERPLKLESKYLGYELIALIDSFKSATTREAKHIRSDEMFRLNEKIDERIDALKRYVSSEDAETVEKVSKLSSEVRILAKARQKHESSFHDRLARNSLRDARTLFFSICLDITKMTGEEYSPHKK